MGYKREFFETSQNNNPFVIHSFLKVPIHLLSCCEHILRMWSSYVVPDIISYAGIITSVIVALRSAAPFLQSLYSSNENSNYFFNFYWYYGIYAVLPLNRLLRSHKGVLMSLPFMSDHVISCVHLVATKSHQYYFTRSDTAQIDLTIHIISY